MTDTSIAARLSRNAFYYGWVVVGVAFITMAFGVNARTAFSLMVHPLTEEFGWDRATVSAAFSIGFITSTALSPVLGLVMDRFGVRFVLPVGVLVTASGLALSTLGYEPWHFYVTLGALVVGGTVTISYIGHGFFVPNWFERKRGLAVGMAYAGVGAGAIVLLPWLQVIIERDGWRDACLTLSLILVVLLVPLNFIFQRTRPRDLGLVPDGTREKPGAPALPDLVVDTAWTAVEWTPRSAMRTARFWFIGVAYTLGMITWYTVLVHQTKFLREIGFTAEFASVALGLVSFTGVLGQIAIGQFSDRMGREVAWTLGMCGFIACYAILLLLEHYPTDWLVYAMVVTQGLFGYGIASVYAAIPADVFPGSRYASIFGLLGLMATIGGAVGPWAGGFIYDLDGRYTYAFVFAGAAGVISIVCIWCAAPRKVRLVAGQAVRRQNRMST